MGYNKYQSLVKELFSLADIQINGNNLWDIQIHDERFYKRAVTEVELVSANHIWTIGGTLRNLMK